MRYDNQRSIAERARSSRCRYADRPTGLSVGATRDDLTARKTRSLSASVRRSLRESRPPEKGACGRSGGLNAIGPYVTVVRAMTRHTKA